MYLAVEGICDASPAVWQTLLAFANAYTDLKTRISNIQVFSQTLAQPTVGVTQDKQAARLAMCGCALPIARAVHAYALKTGNNTLAASVDYSMSDLVGGRGERSAERCQNINAAASTNLSNLASYGITSQKLLTLTGIIAAYNQVSSKPRDTRAQAKTTVVNLQTEMDAADADLVQMDDLLAQLNNAKFASDYTNARIIVDIAASHTVTPPPAPATPAATPRP